MDKETKLKYLGQLARSIEGDAIIQHFQEKIDDLRDGSNYNVDNFERDGLASIKAADVLDGIMKDLKLLKRKKTEKKRNQFT